MAQDFISWKFEFGSREDGQDEMSDQEPVLFTPFILTLLKMLISYVVKSYMRQCQVEVQVLTFLKTKVLVPF